MTYPEADLRYIWDGRGTSGSGATCSITDAEIRLAPRTIFRRGLGWPELAIPVSEVNAVERLLFGRYRFRSVNHSIDGACFRPSGSKVPFEHALAQTGLSIETPPAREKWRWKRLRGDRGCACGPTGARSRRGRSGGRHRRSSRSGAARPPVVTTMVCARLPNGACRQPPAGRPLKTERPQDHITGATPDRSSCRRTPRPRT
jgi:hypothetical protein